MNTIECLHCRFVNKEGAKYCGLCRNKLPVIQVKKEQHYEYAPPPAMPNRPAIRDEK